MTSIRMMQRVLSGKPQKSIELTGSMEEIGMFIILVEDNSVRFSVQILHF